MSDDLRADSGRTLGIGGFLCGPHAPMGLMHVSPGVPYKHALDQASTMLGCVHKLLLTGIDEQEGELMWAAYYLSQFAKALIDDVEMGMG